MTMHRVLQIADTYQERNTANEALEFQRTQLGFIAGRVVDRRSLGEGWLMQSFHDCGNMPLGIIDPVARVVLCPSHLLT